jgi:AMMECR1 domain-containing protein
MLDNLCRKAGLPTGGWKHGAKLSTFQAVVFSEADFK